MARACVELCWGLGFGGAGGGGGVLVDGGGACWAFGVTGIAFEPDAQFANSGSLPLLLVVFCSFPGLVRCAFGRLGVLCVAASAYVGDGFGGEVCCGVGGGDRG